MPMSLLFDILFYLARISNVLFSRYLMMPKTRLKNFKYAI